MRRLNASDDRWICIETPRNTFQIGALLLFDTDAEHTAGAFEQAVRAHFTERLPATPLPVRLVHPPAHFDNGVWLAVGRSRLDLDRQVTRLESESPLDRRRVNELVSAQVLVPWDRELAPFYATVLDQLDLSVADDPGSGALVGLIVQTHHSLADGVGFQAIIEDLTDPSPSPAVRAPAVWRAERAPLAPLWLASSAARFAAAEIRYRRARADRARATDELAALRARPDAKRARTPEVPGMAAQGSTSRSYERMTLPLSGLRAAGKGFGGTVNDALMTVVAGALRRLLEGRSVGGRSALAELGDRPLVALVPRSTRADADGRYGNHLTMMLPNLATHIADPRERFQAIRASMRVEISRDELVQRLAPPQDRPFAARRRRRTAETGTAAGNVSISNVPGPAEPRYLAGYRMIANYPVPNVVEGQFLNVTLRRYGDALQLGLMSDVGRMGEAAPLVPLIRAEYEILSEAARR